VAGVVNVPCTCFLFKNPGVAGGRRRKEEKWKENMFSSL
jgi:hypothetical protein